MQSDIHVLNVICASNDTVGMSGLGGLETFEEAANGETSQQCEPDANPGITYYQESYLSRKCDIQARRNRASGKAAVKDE